MGVDSNGCWMGNWCQDMTLGGCPDVTMVSKRGFMEKKKAMAHRAERQSFISGSGSDYGTEYGSDYGSEYGSDYGSTMAQALTKIYTKPSNNIKWLVKSKRN